MFSTETGRMGDGFVGVFQGVTNPVWDAIKETVYWVPRLYDDAVPWIIVMCASLVLAIVIVLRNTHDSADI